MAQHMGSDVINGSLVPYLGVGWQKKSCLHILAAAALLRSYIHGIAPVVFIRRKADR